MNIGSQRRRKSLLEGARVSSRESPSRVHSEGNEGSRKRGERDAVENRAAARFGEAEIGLFEKSSLDVWMNQVMP